ncbi:MAG: DNA-processing protein DprA, partial [Caldimonas sp.]
LEGPASTIAVVGTGLDRVYPRRHLELAHRIAAEGLIVSEYSLGTPPLPEHFPTRNRIIAGLARGTLVVEAALQSGSLITARLALEAGREVFAIPGSIHAPQSRGCHVLLRQGAKLVERAEDILEELRLPARAMQSVEAPEAGQAKEDPLLAALGFDPVTLDALVARTGWSAAELNVRLLDLELDGRVTRLPGQLFQRLAHG